MMPRFLCLRFPSWPLQRLVALRPELRDAPGSRSILIHQRDARRGEVIRCCSAQAWRRGVRIGMPLNEAKMLTALDQPVIAPHDPTTDGRWLTRIALWCERYSACVGWETIGPASRAAPASPSEFEALFLDITGMDRLFGGESQLAEDLLAKIATRKLTARVGVAETIGAAWAAAWAPTNGGVFIVPSGDLPQALAALPVSALRIANESVELLRQLGVTTIGELLTLPRSGLSARFGDGLLLRLDQAWGQASELIRPLRPPPEYSAEQSLEYPLSRQEQVEQVIHELLARLIQELTPRLRGILRLRCRFDIVGHEPEYWNVGLYQPTLAPRHLQELLRMRLERSQWRGDVSRISLQVELTAPLQSRQRSLFPDNQQVEKEARATLIDRLSCRLGEQAVLQARFVADALPERQIQFHAATASAKGSESRHGGAWSMWRPGQRPLFLLSPPRELARLIVAPDGAPSEFDEEGVRRRVARAWGPERIETGWWRGACVRRDYFRVETDRGERYWLFRRLNDGRWFLHGLLG